MRTVALYVNKHRPRALEIAQAASAIAREGGLAVAGADPLTPLEGCLTPGAVLAQADLVVTIGGDGTLLRGVRVAVPLDIPVFGINTGRLGFLTEVDDYDDLPHVLRDVFDGGFTVEERTALHACVNAGTAHFALNEVVVRRGSNARMAPYGLELDGEPIAHIPSDGVIVATPTGSTAYFLSAGGPIISPNVDAFGVAALLPHTFFARPLIVPAASQIVITCDSETQHATLDLDGAHVADLRPGDRVTIVRAPQSVKFARVRTAGFFMRMHEKLQWGVAIKAPSE
ncbi:MAG: NAD(+)/NADH kinase [Candidatus Velthaea sp.]